MSEKEQHNRYYVASRDDPPLLRFLAPDDSVLDRLREILSQLSPVGYQNNAHYRKDDAIEGDLESIMARLRAILENDYHSNLVEQDEWHGKFEYVVHESLLNPGGVDILTRLYRPGHEGSVSYGRVVQRVDATTYALWADD